MKRIGSLTVAALFGVAVWYAGPGLRVTQQAYAQDNTSYQLSYYDVSTHFDPSAGGFGGPGSSGGTGDALLRVVNDGANGAGAPGVGDVCANIYVFNDIQEQQECCSCPLTPNSLMTSSVIADLTSNPFNPHESLEAGVIKIIGSTGGCSNSPTATTAASIVTIARGLHAWLNHTETMASNQAGFTPPFGFITSTSVARLEPGALSAGELAFLQAGCTAINNANKFGSNDIGICRCGKGD
jgi:hypothetical protein